MAIDNEGHESNLWMVSAVLYTNILLIVSIDMIIFTQYHTWINWVIVCSLTFLLYIIFLICVEHITLFKSSGTMDYTYNSSLVWMNFIFISGICALIDFTILTVNQFFLKRLSNLVKSVKNKNDISYEYIYTFPLELQNLLLKDDKVIEFNKNKDSNIDGNLMVENISINNNEEKKENALIENNEEVEDKKDIPINLMINNDDLNLNNNIQNNMIETDKVNVINQKKQTDFIENEETINKDMEQNKNNKNKKINEINKKNKIQTKKQNSKPFNNITFGINHNNNTNTYNRKNIKIVEHSKNSTRRDLIKTNKSFK